MVGQWHSKSMTQDPEKKSKAPRSELMDELN